MIFDKIDNVAGSHRVTRQEMCLSCVGIYGRQFRAWMCVLSVSKLLVCESHETWRRPAERGYEEVERDTHVVLSAKVNAG